jgi:heme o synthase
MNHLLSSFWQLSKPRIGFMVVVMAALGFYLGAGASLSGLYKKADVFLLSMLGTFVSCCGSAALNNFLERSIDQRMKRTASRVLPCGEIPAWSALLFGIGAVSVGVLILGYFASISSALVALATAVLYVGVYTPLKQITWYNTFIGAIPGALPPLGGWLAATNELELGAVALFVILFIWQHPHFFAIAWMYRSEYKDAGFCMLPSVDNERGDRTTFQMILYAWLLIPASLLLVYSGHCGWIYGAGSLYLSWLIVRASRKFALSRSREEARRVLFSTLYFLPGLFGLIAIDTSLYGWGYL